MEQEKKNIGLHIYIYKIRCMRNNLTNLRTENHRSYSHSHHHFVRYYFSSFDDDDDDIDLTKRLRRFFGTVFTGDGSDRRNRFERRCTRDSFFIIVIIITLFFRIIFSCIYV